ncbi:hypothetical protein [Brevibacillus massiliensis]|nr:hypothetical protein [Brevibacillus massiliensis]
MNQTVNIRFLSKESMVPHVQGKTGCPIPHVDLLLRMIVLTK